MASITKIINEMEELEARLPEAASLEVLEKYNDIVLLRGMKEMRRIIDTPMERKKKTEDGVEVNILDPSNKIKAFSALISLGKYIETRKQNEAKSSEHEIDFASTGMVVDVEDSEEDDEQDE